MTIHELGYRPLDAARIGRIARLRPLWRFEFMTPFRLRVNLITLFGYLAVLMPTIINLVVLLIRLGVMKVLQESPVRNMRGHQLPQHVQEEMLRFDPEAPQFYSEMVLFGGMGMLPFLLVSCVVASRSIAKDRATNALELYWTRGITPLGYFAAKWLGSCCLMATTMVLAPMLLWLTGVMLAEDWTFLDRTLVFMPRVLLGLTVFTVVLSYLSVAFSALSSSANMATVLWLMLVAGSSAAGHIVGHVLNSPRLPGSVSIWDGAATLAGEIAGVPRHDGSFEGAAGLVGGVLLGVTILMLRRLRLREAIA
jgi:hypothetical protein